VSGRDFASIHDRPKPEVFITRLNSGAVRLAKAIAVKHLLPGRGEGGGEGWRLGIDFPLNLALSRMGGEGKNQRTSYIMEIWQI
jgi:hypothetical protein